MYDGDDYSLEGDMSVPSSRKSNAQPGEPDFNTLDEPIKETIVSLTNIVQHYKTRRAYLKTIPFSYQLFS